MNASKEAELLKALTTEAKTAAELRNELKIDESAKRIGKALMRLAKLNQNIIVDKVHGVNFYYLKNGIIKDTPKLPEKEKEIPITNMAHNLEQLIHELKEEGVNVQEVCYYALRDRKEKLESELRYVSENAPTFKESYDKMKEQLHKALNQLQDLKDMSDKLESMKVMKGLMEQRKASIE